MGILRKTLNWYAKLSPSRGKVKPPYEHVVQIGDPRLRNICDEVPVEIIKTHEIQKLILILEHVLKKYSSVGMSAPQVGINKRIFVMKHTASQIKSEPPEIVKTRNLYEVPFTVYINPVVKVVDYQKVIHPEGCESVKSFIADVARYKTIEVSGYNAAAEPVSQTYTGWPARIVQHEMDHLNGKLYTDIMDRKTLQCVCWEEINLSKGKVAIPYSPE